MAASSAGALKAFLEAQGLGISFYRDRAPEGTDLPYATIDEAIAFVPDALEDGEATTGKETVSIDIWMTWKDTTTGKLAESYALPRQVARALHGQALNAAPTRAYAVIVHRIGPRLVEEEENLVHVPIQAVVWQEI